MKARRKLARAVRLGRALGLGAFLLAAAPLATPPAEAQTRAKKAPPLPPVEASVRIEPGAKGAPWTMRVQNDGSETIRVPADVRLLSLDFELSEKGRRKKLTCSAPAAMRPDDFPDDRALFLAPGERYVVDFDPHLLCFGKSAAALEGGALLRPRFGWKPPPAWSRAAPKPPFAAQQNKDPETRAPLRQLEGPPLLLSYREAPPPPPLPEPSPAAPAEAPDLPGEEPKTRRPPAQPGVVDVHAARLELLVPPFVEAHRPRSASLRVTIRNAGERPTKVVVRTRMMSFQVLGPDGLKTCDAAPPSSAVPRDLFRTLKPKGKIEVPVLLSEVCSRDVFARPGVYVVRPTLHANESAANADLDVYTGTVTAEVPARIRLATGPEPFHASPPAVAGASGKAPGPERPGNPERRPGAAKKRPGSP